MTSGGPDANEVPTSGGPCLSTMFPDERKTGSFLAESCVARSGPDGIVTTVSPDDTEGTSVVATAGDPTDASPNGGGAIEAGTDGLFASEGASFRATLSFGDIASETYSRRVRLHHKKAEENDLLSQNDCAEQPMPPAVPKTKGGSHGLPYAEEQRSVVESH